MKTILKRMGVLFTILVLAVGFSGCDPSSYRYDYEEYHDKVVTIELIEYDGRDTEYNSGIFNPKALDFDFEMCTVIETLDAQYNDAFLQDISMVEVLIFSAPSNAPAGQGIRIFYEDGSFTVISWGMVEDVACEYYGDFNADGSVKGHWGGEDYLNSSHYMYVAANYFETKIELK